LLTLIDLLHFFSVFFDDDGRHCFSVLLRRQRNSSSSMLLTFVSKNLPIQYSLVIIQSFDDEWLRVSSNNTRNIGAIISHLGAFA
jgi:hypothetical protein